MEIAKRQDEASPSRTGRIWQSVRDSVAAALSGPRLQLASKAGLAAGLAFLIAPLMPGAAAQYPYYAPLGALVAMYENVSGSMKQGVQTLVGLGLGIGLAFLLVSFSDPSPVTVAVVMGLGVLLAGLPRLGAGRDWIPTAALLVLLVGGNNPDDFSFGYLVQMGVGVVVGIAVNMLVFPPLHFKAAALSLAELRWALAKQLSDMGAALRESWPPEHEDWAVRSEALAQSARAVRAAVQKADASRQVNPRRRLHSHDVDQDYKDLSGLESVTFHIRDMTEVLSDVIWDKDVPFVIPLPYSEPLADALDAVGEVMRSMEAEPPDKQNELIARANAAVDALAERMASDDVKPHAPSATGSIVLNLHRILRAVTAGRP
ncbi:FUSC family protein [Arthrobacter sp. ISL-69]|nr:FUSC family protein [Arthrobacter sp. ISL-69]